MSHDTNIIRYSGVGQDRFKSRDKKLGLQDMCGMIDDGWRDRLLHAVERSGKSREAIATEAGLGRAYFYGVFKENKVPSITNLIGICDVIGASPAFVLFGWQMTEKHQKLLDLLADNPDQIDNLIALLDR